MMYEQNDAHADRPKFARLFELLDEIRPIADEDWDIERYTSEWPERLSLQALDAESS